MGYTPWLISVTCHLALNAQQILKMNKPVVLIAISCVLALVAMEISAQYYGGTPGAVVNTGYGYGTQNTAYSQYLAQLERYNQAQQLKTLTTATRGLRNSALVSLASLFAISLFATNSTGTLAG